MKTILISNNLDLAKSAEFLGIDAIMVDLELEGKVERQKSRNTFITSHEWTDVEKVSKALSPGTDLIVRINPYSERTKSELEKIKDVSINYIMQPMIQKADDVLNLTADMKSVGVQAKILPLIEHINGLNSLDEILQKLPDMKRVFFGLNDMSLSLKLPFLFQCLTEGYIAEGAEICKSHDVEFGFGGIGRLGTENLIAPDLILSEHACLGSNGVILSRAFCTGYEFLKSSSGIATQSDLESLKTEVSKVKTRYKELVRLKQADFSSNKTELKRLVDGVVSASK